MKAIHIALPSFVLGMFLVVMISEAQGPPPTPQFTQAVAMPAWADIQVGPNLTVVILRDNAPEGDMVVVRTFFWQKLQGIDQPIMRSVLDVIPSAKNVAVAANGAPDPAAVSRVHLDMVKLTDRLEWAPKPAVSPPTPEAPKVP